MKIYTMSSKNKMKDMIIAKYEDVTLRRFEESDIPKKVEWINNPANNRYLHYDLPLKIDTTIDWYHKKDNSQRLDCVIEYKGIPVGLIGLLQIDKANSKAEYYVTIGDTSVKHEGIATKASKGILDYAFSKLQLHKIYLTVDAQNHAAIKLYQKLGFRQEGYFVDDCYCQRYSKFIDRKRFSFIKAI